MLFAILFLIPVFIYIGSPTTTLDQIIENSPAMEANLHSGDMIKKVDGKSINSWNEFTDEIASSNGKELTLVVERDNKEIQIILQV